MVQDFIAAAIAQHALPPDFTDTVTRWYLPLAEKITAQARQLNRPLVLGIQGTQGSGKSTLADFLRLIFEHQYQLSCVSLSIDDFYLTRAERAQLAETAHPLLITRGVPGTHDVQLAIDTIEQLTGARSASDGNPVNLVRFNKAVDDRAPESDWDEVQAPVDIVILEGWCVGLRAEESRALIPPLNDLERIEDRDASWRLHVNNQLAYQYPKLFNMLDRLVVLKAPSFECVYQWRLLQEKKLEDKCRQEGTSTDKILSPAQVSRFISHYQRLTEHGLRTLPLLADWTLPLNADHQICEILEKDPA